MKVDHILPKGFNFLYSSAGLFPEIKNTKIATFRGKVRMLSDPNSTPIFLQFRYYANRKWVYNKITIQVKETDWHTETLCFSVQEKSSQLQMFCSMITTGAIEMDDFCLLLGKFPMQVSF